MISFLKSFFKNTDIKQEWNPQVNINNKYPPEWLDIHYKTYPRFEQYTIKKPDKLSGLEKIIKKRRSFRQYDKDYKIPYRKLNSIMYSLNNVSNRDAGSSVSRRNYPSGGARYPVEQYLVIFNVEEIASGIYHVNVYDNTLELISSGNKRRFFEDICNSDWIGDAAAILVLSCIPERTTIKYGNRGVRYILLEIGHIAQNFMLLAESQNLKTCAVGGFEDDKLRRFLRCDKIDEYPLYLIACGK